MKNKFKNLAAAIMISGLLFVPVLCSAQVEGSSVNDGIVPGHAYTVLGTYEQDGKVYVILRNPWGNIEVEEEEIYLQSIMQSENREFQAISNVFKVRQDTANSTINNVR